MFRLATVLIGWLVAIGTIMGASDGLARLRDPHVSGTELWLQTSAKSLCASGGCSSYCKSEYQNIAQQLTALRNLTMLSVVRFGLKISAKPPLQEGGSHHANRDVGSISSA